MELYCDLSRTHQLHYLELQIKDSSYGTQHWHFMESMLHGLTMEQYQAAIRQDVNVVG